MKYMILGHGHFYNNLYNIKIWNSISSVIVQFGASGRKVMKGVPVYR